MNTEDIIRCYFAEKIREATGKTISWRELNIEYDSQNDYCWSEYTHDPAYAKITVWRGSEVIAELDGLEDFGGLIQELVAFAAKVDN